MATSPNALGGMQVVTDTHIVTQTVQVVNTGTEPFGWSVEVSAAPFPVVVTPTQGVAGAAFTVTFDPRCLSIGAHSAAITITADADQVLESPLALPVHVVIVDRIHRAYLPLVHRL
jgi:hypothetical protein